VRNHFADTFYKLAKQDDRLCLICADISPAGSMTRFRQEFPSRFINVGVSEQSMIGIAAGMAQRGFRPFCYTIATFTLYRPFEMIRDDLCYQNLPVTIVGIGGGLTYSTLGATHHAQEDVVVAAALPNMTVLAPCDPTETEAATRWCAEKDHGPTYLRLGKAGEKDFTSSLAKPWRFNELRMVYANGYSRYILTYGSMVKHAVALADQIGGAVVVVSTLKPLTDLRSLLQNGSSIVVIEESSPYLALRTRALAQEVGAMCQISTFSLKDEFIHCYGAHDDLLDAHGLSVEHMSSMLKIN
jgi:transketolase